MIVSTVTDSDSRFWSGVATASGGATFRNHKSNACGELNSPAMHALSTKIPIVMARAADPLIGGLVPSLARPGGNITGFSTQAAEITSKLVAILHELVPNFRRVAMVASRPTWPLFSAAQDNAARALGIQSIYIDLPIPAAISTALTEATSRNVSGVIMRGTPFFSAAHRTMIVEAAASHRMPAMYESRDYVEAGGLAAYATDGVELYRQVAAYVARILNGERAGDLPIQQPTKFELVINLRTAKALGLTVPSRLLFTADEVIE